MFVSVYASNAGIIACTQSDIYAWTSYNAIKQSIHDNWISVAMTNNGEMIACSSNSVYINVDGTWLKQTGTALDQTNSNPESLEGTFLGVSITDSMLVVYTSTRVFLYSINSATWSYIDSTIQIKNASFSLTGPSYFYGELNNTNVLYEGIYPVETDLEFSNTIQSMATNNTGENLILANSSYFWTGPSNNLTQHTEPNILKVSSGNYAYFLMKQNEVFVYYNDELINLNIPDTNLTCICSVEFEGTFPIVCSTNSIWGYQGTWIKIFTLSETEKVQPVHPSRSVGVFRAGTTTLGSNTVSRDNFFSLKRSMAVQHAEQNRKWKVGVMASSQRTALKVSSFANLRTQFATVNYNDVKNAKRRTRNAGSVPPAKKGANQSAVSSISYGGHAGNRTYKN